MSRLKDVYHNRYFYHFGYYSSPFQTKESWITTNRLIEVTKGFYENELVPLEIRMMKSSGIPWNRPCKYREGQIPAELTIMEELPK